MMRHKIVDSPIGQLLLAADEAGVCRIHLMKPGGELRLMHSCDLLEQAACELNEYFAQRRRSFSFPISMHGTVFEMRVWQALMEIPYGEIRTYGQLAAQLGMPKAARAVGGACSRNPVLLAVPCHRVIAASGMLTGFAAGMPAKRTLLALEGHEIRQNCIRL